jgi:hypothetical protein
MSGNLTVPEKLLLAALRVRERRPTFTAEDLVVQAWQLFPDTFGLAGYGQQYPDSNRVLTKIMGSGGMRGKGWLRKVGEKQYRLTSKALSDAEQLLTRSEGSDGSAGSSALATAALRAELDRQTARALERIACTQAAQKILDCRLEEISFHEVSGFWDITARSNANTLIARLNDTELLLKRAKAAATKDGGGALRLSSVTISAEGLDQLLQGHAQLQDRFAPELEIIRRRTDERLERKVRV